MRPPQCRSSEQAAPAPRLTVLMSVFNAGRFLETAMDSILGQDWRDFEFLIVNDGSTDRTRSIILDCDDPRIRLVDNARNLGPAGARDRGLALARGELVSVIDSDDIAYPRRLWRQVGFLDSHRDAVAVGCAYDLVGVDGKKLGRIAPVNSPAGVAWTLMFHNCVGHSFVTYRRAVALRAGGYREGPAEDYDLLSRMARAGPIYNTKDTLGAYRMHPGSYGSANRPREEENAAECSYRQMRWLLGRSLSRDAARAARALALGGDGISGDNVDLAVRTYMQLFRSFLAPRARGALERAEIAVSVTECLIQAAMRCPVSMTKRRQLADTAVRTYEANRAAVLRPLAWGNEEGRSAEAERARFAARLLGLARLLRAEGERGLAGSFRWEALRANPRSFHTWKHIAACTARAVLGVVGGPLT